MFLFNRNRKLLLSFFIRYTSTQFKKSSNSIRFSSWTNNLKPHASKGLQCSPTTYCNLIDLAKVLCFTLESHLTWYEEYLRKKIFNRNNWNLIIHKCMDYKLLNHIHYLLFRVEVLLTIKSKINWTRVSTFL